MGTIGSGLLTDKNLAAPPTPTLSNGGSLARLECTSLEDCVVSLLLFDRALVAPTSQE